MTKKELKLKRERWHILKEGNSKKELCNFCNKLVEWYVPFPNSDYICYRCFMKYCK